MSSILIKNGYVLDVVNKEKSGVKDIYIENEYIKEIGEKLSKKADYVINAENKVVMPGLINTHNHSAMTLFRGYADDMNLKEWLETKIWPAEDRLVGEDVYYGSLLAILEMLKSGTTFFNDMYFFTEDTVKAVKETGIRAMLGRCVMAVENDEDLRVKEAIDIIEKYSKDTHIYTCIAPHAPYTCNEKAIEKCVEISKKYDIPYHIHLSETKSEVDNIKEKYGMSPVEYLNSKKVFEQRVILAHGVWFDDKDIEILKNIKGGISHNPISNCKLGSGIANVVKYIQNGLLVSIGTDGAGSTNTLDMFQEMKLTSLLQKVNHLKADIIDSYKVIQMATIDGAKVLGLEDKIGSIDEGKYADIIIVNADNMKFKPANDIFSNIVYVGTGDDVETTIVHGKVLMENKKVLNIDEEKIVKKCEEISKRIFNC